MLSYCWPLAASSSPYQSIGLLAEDWRRHPGIGRNCDQNAHLESQTADPSNGGFKRHAGGAERRHDGRIAVISETAAGVPMDLRLAAIMAIGSGSPLRSIAVIVRP
jgi:hypothetical protein